MAKDKIIKELKIEKIKLLFILLFLAILFMLSIALLDKTTNDKDYLKQQLQSYQEELGVPKDLVFKYSCYWENLGIYQEIHLELDDFETYNGWFYRLKNEEIYEYCEVIK